MPNGNLYQLKIKKLKRAEKWCHEKISKFSILMGWTLPITGMWRGEVFAISDCLVQLRIFTYTCPYVWFGLVCWSLTSLCHSNGHIETMPAREINPFTALTRIRSQFLRTQWSTSNHQRVDTTTPQTAKPSGLAPVPM